MSGSLPPHDPSRRSDAAVRLGTPRDPQTPAEWRDALLAAELLLTLSQAAVYGLIDEHGQVQLERCESVVECARTVGLQIVPRLLVASPRIKEPPT